MKHFLILIATGSLQLYAQTETTQPLEFKTSFWRGIYLEQDEQKFTLRQAQDLMESVPLAFEEMKKANSNNAIATLLGVVGGGMVGWTLGTAAGGGDPEWILAGIGGGLIIAAIPLYSTASEKAKKAADIYNETLGYVERKKQFNVNMNLNGNGVGLVISF